METNNDVHEAFREMLIAFKRRGLEPPEAVALPVSTMKDLIREINSHPHYVLNDATQQSFCGVKLL